MTQLFKYRAVNTEGITVKGVIEATHRRFARGKLLSKSFTHIRLQRTYHFNWFSKKINPKKIILFFQQLAVLQQAGIPLIESLSQIHKNLKPSDHKLTRIVEQIQREITEGHTLSVSLSRFSKQFNPLITRLIYLGESSGKLDLILDHILVYLEKKERLKKRLVKIMIYPTAVISFALFTLLLMLIFVIPQFKTIFEKQHALLPLPTRLILHASQQIRFHGIEALFLIFLTIWIMKNIVRNNKKINSLLENLLLKIPLIRYFFHSIMNAKISHALSIALDSGIPILDTITIIRTIIPHHRINRSLLQAYKSISEGGSIHQAFSAHLFFPQTAISLIETGEKTGRVDLMFQKIADESENRANTTLDLLSDLMEPLIMIVVGGIIGAIVIAMYLPIFRLGSIYGI